MAPTAETTTLDIEGMSCAACAAAVEKSLNRTPGVQSALVNYATEKATISYTPTRAMPWPPGTQIPAPPTAKLK
jgi:Cu+-exporting ATPase